MKKFIWNRLKKVQSIDWFEYKTHLTSCNATLKVMLCKCDEIDIRSVIGCRHENRIQMLVIFLLPLHAKSKV